MTSRSHFDVIIYIDSGQNCGVDPLRKKCKYVMLVYILKPWNFDAYTYMQH